MSRDETSKNMPNSRNTENFDIEVASNLTLKTRSGSTFARNEADPDLRVEVVEGGWSSTKCSVSVGRGELNPTSLERAVQVDPLKTYGPAGFS